MTTQDTKTPAAPVASGMSRGWRWVLIGSLGLNLLVLGLAAGAMLDGRPGGPFRSVDLATGPLVAALSDDDRRAIRTDLMRSAQLARPTAADRAAEAVALLGALRAEPFSPQALSLTLDGMRARVGSATEAAQAALIARIAAMTPDERMGFAARLEAELTSGGRHMDDMDGGRRSGGD